MIKYLIVVMFMSALNICNSQSSRFFLYDHAKYIRISPYSTADSISEGIKEISQFIQLQPTDSAYILRAELKFRMDEFGRFDYSDAIADCDTAIAIGLTNPWGYSFRAFLRAKSDDLPGALHDDSMLALLDPLGGGHYEMGVIYRSFHQYLNALNEYNIQIYSIDSGNRKFEWYLARADVKFDLGYYESALKDLDTSLSYLNDCFFCFDLIFRICTITGHPENACPYLIKARKLGYNDFDKQFENYCDK